MVLDGFFGRSQALVNPRIVYFCVVVAAALQVQDGRWNANKMVGVISKPAEEIGVVDIEALIESAVCEGQEIEFKESLSTRGASIDPWLKGKDSIGDKARNALLREVTAFANAYGGVLLLGIAESTAKPAVAERLSHIPRCAELAERLKLVLRDGVEPQIPRVEVFGVITEGDRGVVVIRVARSRMAPHRVRPTRACPVRRADRTEDLTMREIQDMTLNVARGLDRLERKFSDRAEHFEREFSRLVRPGHAWGLRVTACPVVEDIRIERLYGTARVLEPFDEPWRRVLRRSGESERALVDGPIPRHWRPILRGARAECEVDAFYSTELHAYREINCDGLVEGGCLSCSADSEGSLSVDRDLPMFLFANTITQVDRLRRSAGVPTVEYGVELEVRVMAPCSLRVVDGRFPHAARSFPRGPTAFPRYVLGGTEDVGRLLALFDRDFWNCLGVGVETEVDEIAINGWPVAS